MAQFIIFLGLIIAVIWAFVVFPTFRIVVGILVLITGGLIYVANQNATEEQKKSEIKKEQERVACEAKKKASEEADKKNWIIVRPSQVEVRDTLLTAPSFGDAYNVTASVKNRSAVNVSAVRLNVVAYDCPAEATNTTQCEIVGHQEEEFYSNIPAGEVRQVKGAVTLPNVPKSRGKFSWSFRVVGVKAGSEPEIPDFLAKWVRCG